MIIVLGDEEVNSKCVAVRDRRTREQYNLSEDAFLTLIKEKINEVNFWLKNKTESKWMKTSEYLRYAVLLMVVKH